jgi:arabinan endo-1,5-alpha-L-arabinosidase
MIVRKPLKTIFSWRLGRVGSRPPLQTTPITSSPTNYTLLQTLSITSPSTNRTLRCAGAHPTRINHFVVVILFLFNLTFAQTTQEATIQETSTQTTTYTNPVVTPVAADPDIIRTEDGTFYLYATQDNWADNKGDRYLPIFKSEDLVNWEFVKNAFVWPATWKQGGGFYWAPDISFYEGTYYLYYAASIWGDSNPCIGLATATNPEGPWEDLGQAVFCSDDIGVENSIDAFAWYEDGKRYLIWGSFHGIYLVELNTDGTAPISEPVLIADQRFEAPYILEREGYYYLFLSIGSCCEGERSSYQLIVGRSENLAGPYLDKNGGDLAAGGGTLILGRNDVWVGPGHNSVITDDAGNDWLVYHAIPKDDPRLINSVNRRPTLIDLIEWQEGWPVINGGEGPSFEPRAVPEIVQ